MSYVIPEGPRRHDLYPTEPQNTESLSGVPIRLYADEETEEVINFEERSVMFADIVSKQIIDYLEAKENEGKKAGLIFPPNGGLYAMILMVPRLKEYIENGRIELLFAFKNDGADGIFLLDRNGEKSELDEIERTLCIDDISDTSNTEKNIKKK